MSPDAFIAVLGGDGMAERWCWRWKICARSRPSLDLVVHRSAAGRGHDRETGKSMPESTVRLCDEADAILLGACGLPSVRYPDNTEIMPQVELRFHFDLYAGVRRHG